MAERNEVKPRTCSKCNKMFPSTAAQIKEHAAICR